MYPLLNDFFEVQKYFLVLNSSFIFYSFADGNIDNIVSTFRSVVKLNIEIDSVALMLSNIVYRKP